MSSYFYSVFSPKIKAFAICYPSEYNDSYIDKRAQRKISGECKKIMSIFAAWI